MLGTTFYNETIKRYVELFGWLFRDITIQRSDANNTIIQQQIVPIDYTGGEKYLARTIGDPEIERAIAQQLPRLAYDLIGIQKDTSRQVNPLNKLVCFSANGVPSAYFVPVPYNFIFSLSLKGRNTEDMYKVAEQIFPYFSPSFTVSAVIIDGMSPQTIPFNLDSVDMSDNYQGPTATDRTLIWNFNFTLNGNFYGPNLDSSTQKVIRWVRTNESEGITSNTIDISSNSYPTLTGKTLDQISPTDNYVVKTDIILDNT
jgi:hypothetical protein